MSTICVFLNKIDLRILITRIIAPGIALNLLLLLAACGSPTPSKIAATPVTPRVEITALTALAHGRLIQSDGCLYLQSSDFNKNYTLFWPPDFSVTLEGDNVKVVSGMVTGIQKEDVLQIGENLTLGGGTFDRLSEENLRLISANCLGPYWVVGSIVSHGP
jgi:hypothetical protein